MTGMSLDSDTKQKILEATSPHQIFLGVRNIFKSCPQLRNFVCNSFEINGWKCNYTISLVHPEYWFHISMIDNYGYYSPQTLDKVSRKKIKGIYSSKSEKDLLEYLLDESKVVRMLAEERLKELEND